MAKKKVVYISGPITGIKHYWRPFEKAEDELNADGCIALNPTSLPEGLTDADYLRICLAMLDSADEVLMLPGWQKSKGANIEWRYARYKGIPVRMFDEKEVPTSGR